MEAVSASLQLGGRQRKDRAKQHAATVRKGGGMGVVKKGMVYIYLDSLGLKLYQKYFGDADRFQSRYVLTLIHDKILFFGSSL